MNPRIQRLRAEIQSDRAALDGHLDVVASLALEDAGPAVLARAAWSLHHAYTAVESILERVARTVEGSVPEGADWHKALLDDAALEIPTTRPALLGRATVRALHDLRTFRHFVRHAYAVELASDRLVDLQGRAHRLRAPLLADLTALDAWLAQIAAQLDD